MRRTLIVRGSSRYLALLTDADDPVAPGCLGKPPDQNAPRTIRPLFRGRELRPLKPGVVRSHSLPRNHEDLGFRKGGWLTGGRLGWTGISLWPMTTAGKRRQPDSQEHDVMVHN